MVQQQTRLEHRANRTNGGPVPIAVAVPPVAGAAVDAQRDQGVTALMLACGNGFHEIARLLLQTSMSPNTSDANGYAGSRPLATLP